MTALSKKKAAVTRVTGEPQSRSRLTASFGGVLQSTVKGPGMTPSLTYQPFSVLQLARCAGPSLCPTTDPPSLHYHW